MRGETSRKSMVRQSMFATTHLSAAALESMGHCPSAADCSRAKYLDWQKHPVRVGQPCGHGLDQPGSHGLALKAHAARGD